jgi:hypothetical protein
MRIALAVLLSGCSVAFTNSRAQHAEAREDCPGYVAPAIDTALAVDGLAMAVRELRASPPQAPPPTSAGSIGQAFDGALDQALHAPWVEDQGARNTNIGLGLVMASAFAISAATGYLTTHRCRSGYYFSSGST